MSTIVVSADFKSVTRALTEISQGSVKQAARRSIKRSLKTVGKKATMEIRARKLLDLSAKSAKTRFRQFDNTRASSIADMQGKLWISGRTENLARFYAKRVRMGRSVLTGTPLYGVRVNVMGQSRVEPGAFMWRRGKGAIVLARTTSKRFPLEKRKGPSPSEIVQKSGMLTELIGIARARYSQEFEQNLNFYVERAIQRAQASVKG